MKKLITVLAAMAIVGGVSAQSKTAYLDLYQRGGAQHLRTTLIFYQEPIYLGKKNLGEVLNMLAGLGWEIDKTLHVRRIAYFFPWTRHKFHIILKKEYQEGENPYEGIKGIKYNDAETQEALSSREDDTNINKYECYKRTDLKEVHIPKNIVNIGKYAFAFCSNLKTIYCEAITPPRLGFCAFDWIPKSAKIYVPIASERLYKEAKGLKKYADYIVGYDFK